MDFKKRMCVGMSCEFHMSITQARQIVNYVFKSIADELLSRGVVQFRRFGTFLVKACAARVARNPRTNEQYPIPETYRLRFQPASSLSTRIRKQA